MGHKDQLAIDDQRTLGPKDLVHKGPVTYARTFEQAKMRLFEAMTYKRPPWDVIYFDHDLGDYAPDHTGWDLLKWLLEYSRSDRLPRIVRVITMNGAVMSVMRKIADEIMNLRRDCTKGDS